MDTPFHPPTIAPPLPVAQPLTPVAVKERILTLDVLRGFALLGIFMVNMRFFGYPFMHAIRPPALADAPGTEQWAWAAVAVLFEYKFVSLFSLLFGIGFSVQLIRAKARGGNFVPVYLRRSGVLLAIGLLHALLLWYGDILFIYAVISLSLLITMSFRPKWLITTAACLLLFSSILVAGLTLLGVLTQSSDQPAHSTTVEAEGGRNGDSPSADSDKSTSDAQPSPLPQRVGELSRSDWDPESDAWINVETRAYRHGPFIEAFLIRAVSWFYCLIFTAISFGWHIMAMFLLGAGLMKLNFFTPAYSRWHWGLALVAFPLGLALEGCGAYVQWVVGHEISWPMVGMAALREFSSVMLCLGYVGVWSVVVQSGAMRWLVKALSCTGRMALTNYLTQTVIATGLMYWWGFGWFGEVSRANMIGLVLVIYVSQIVLSVLWMRAFAIGPMEWLWRSLTYWKLQPVRHGGDETSPGAVTLTG